MLWSLSWARIQTGLSPWGKVSARARSLSLVIILAEAALLLAGDFSDDEFRKLNHQVFE